MSRLPMPNVECATGATAELFARIKKAAGKVPNTFARMIRPRSRRSYRPTRLSRRARSASRTGKPSSSRSARPSGTARPRTACLVSLPT